MVFFHADSGVCLRRVTRYVEGLHMRLAAIAEHAVDSLVQADAHGDL